MKKVIITGATGMIGVSLINFLIKKNIEVLAISRKNSLRKNNIPENKNVKIIECNLDKLKDLSMQENDFDVFYHFGWDGTFGESRNDISLQEKNAKYTVDSVRLAKKCGCKKLIGAGSQAEYGRVEGLIDENTTENPENEYGKAKLRAGIESRRISNDLGLEHIWTRIFSSYGPYDGNSTMIMTSIREMLNGDSPEYTKGEQKWDYLFSEDLAKMFYLLGEYGKGNNIYCLASGKTQKLHKYIETIRNIINPNIELKLGNIPYSSNQVMNLNVNIDKFVLDFKYRPETSFKNGIEKTIDWYKNSNVR